MSSITTRSGKGSPLTNSEVDDNFTNLNTDKLENITGESIKSLSDVYSSMSPSDGQALVFDSTNGWQAENVTTDTSALMPKAGGTFTGNVSFGDNDKALFGAGSDLEIFHDGSHSFIKDVGTGHLKVLANSLLVQNSTGYNRIFADQSGPVNLYYGTDGIPRINTTSAGVKVTGDAELSGAAPKLTFNDVTGGTQIDFSLQANNGTFTLTDETNSDTVLTAAQNGATQIYYNGTEKLATSNTGVTVTGNIANSSGDMTIDVAGDLALDVGGATIFFQDDGATWGYIENQTTDGAFDIKSSTNNYDMRFRGTDNGNTITALTLDMSNAGTATFNDDVKLSDSKRVKLGNGGDLQLLHDGGGTSHISNYTGHLYISNYSDDADIKIQTDNGQGNVTDYILADGSDGSVHLMHYGSTKLQTINTGVTVSGTLAATAVTGDGSGLTNLPAQSDSTKMPLAGGVFTGFVGFGTQYTTPQGPSYAIDIKGDSGTTSGSNTIKLSYGDNVNNWLLITDGSTSSTIQARNKSLNIATRHNHNISFTRNNSNVGAFNSSGFNVVGNITLGGTVDGRDVASDGLKLDGIATGANVGIPTTGGTFTGDVTFSGTNHSGVTWDTSSDEFLFAEGSRIDFGGGANIRRESDGILRITGATAANTYFNFSNNLIFYRGGSAAAQMMIDGTTQRFHAYGNITVGGTVDGVDIATNIPSTLGSAGQVLTVNSGGTAGEWADGAVSNVGTGNFIGGTNAGANLESGAQENTLLGQEAGNDITSGRYNTIVGKDAGPLLTTAQANTFVGWQSGQDTTGGANTFLGYRAGRYATTGISNVFVGYEAGDGSYGTANTGQYNTAIGRHALGVISSGINNVAIGCNAGDTITSGSRNIVIGEGADASSATISNEITIGSQNHTRFRLPGVQHNAANGSVLQYNSSTGLIGLSAIQTDLIYDASPQLGGNLDTRTHNINFPQLNSSSMSSNYLSFGDKFFFVCQQGYNRIISDSSSTGFEIKGNVMKLMTATQNENYLVATKDGSVELYYDNSKKFETASTGITVTGDVNSTSDIRAKKNIETIEGALEKISLLRGVTFDWDNDVEGRATGVIAQDVEKVLPEAVRDNAETGFKSVAYGNMVGLLVEAIKEQQTQIDELKDRVKKLNG